MKDATILRIGIVGAVFAAICCATPVLVVAHGAIDLSAWVGGLDFVLLPALVLFLVVTATAYDGVTARRPAATRIF
jgi:mercuric ion transport protein